jgi:D-alanine-D-alanine ligase
MRLKDKVAVLYGGESDESEVSHITADAVIAAMDELSIDYEKIELTGEWIIKLKLLKPDFAFLALHGSPGEDGTVQAVLDSLKIAYNGSGVLASALVMDKSRSKKIARLSGLDVANEAVFKEFSKPKLEMIESIGLSLPVVVKPVNGGSSLGVSIVTTPEQWEDALKHVEGYGSFMVEEYIPGMELTVGMLGDTPLAVTEIIANEAGFYDYDSKYKDGGSEHIIPANLDDAEYKALMDDAVKVVNAFGCTGVSRVDFRYDPATKRRVLLEANTLPGLTSTSLVPEQAAYKGMNFNLLIMWMMEDVKWQKQVKAV